MTGGGGFDWPEMLRTAVQDGGISPDAFWSMTPAELKLVLGWHEDAAPLTRARLQELDKLYSKLGAIRHVDL